jgi:hypothetical protein
MLYLKADEPRTLTFEVDIRGVGKSELKGYVRLFINDAEHGFPVSIDDGIITADIPPLTEIIRLKTMEDGDVIEAKLDLMTDQHIFTPWQGEVKVSVPMGIKAKLSNETLRPVNSGSSMVAKVVETKQDKEATKKTKKVVQEFDTSEEKMLKVTQEKYKEDLMAMVADTIKQMGLVPGESKQESLMEKNSGRTTKKEDGTKERKTPDKILEEVQRQSKLNERDLLIKKLKNITEEQIYKYMEKAGTKNPKIQTLVYEQAVAAAQSGEPFKVLQQVVKILKKRQI